MELATFIASAKTSHLFREARLAMLTHRALHHIDIADAAAAKAEKAVAELIVAMHQAERSPVRRPVAWVPGAWAKRKPS
jgi:hypothetical protein